MASTSNAYMHAAVAFSKVPGTLSALHSESLRWVPSSASTNVQPFNIRFSDIAGLQASKPGSDQAALMVALSNGVMVTGKSKILLIFNASQTETALSDRETFKNELANAVRKNRAQQQSEVVNSGTSSAVISAAATENPSPAPPPTHGRAVTPAITDSITPTRGSPAPAVTATATTSLSSKHIEKPPPKTEMELRISVIKSNPQLRSLHKDIVISGAMSDSEFWSHPQRQALIRSERARLEQRQGRNAKLADPKPTPNEVGELKLSITPQLIRDLFQQFPIVAKAYDDTVPSKLDEGSFWTRYFQSKLYHRLRTSARSAASEHIVQDDPIFDQYLQDEDDQLEPRKSFNPHDRLLDLAATAEDHQETGNEKDWTMRPGAERRTLPLMRRFNDHSQSLLDSALGDLDENASKKRRKVGGVGEEYGDDSLDPRTESIQNHYYKEIVIDDLNETETVEKVRLDMKDLDHYLSNSKQDGGGSTVNDDDTTTRHVESQLNSMSEMIEILTTFDTNMQNWNPNLGEYRPVKKQAESAMKTMLENIRSRTQAKGLDEFKSLSESIQKQVISCHASTTEFLRQFWSTIAPPQLSFSDTDDWSRLVENSRPQSELEKRKQVQDKTDKAIRMYNSLIKSLDKIKSVANLAEQEIEYGSQLVLSVLQPTLDAIEKVIQLGKQKGW